MNSNTGGVKNRKKSALQRLEQQLIDGVKTPKGFNNSLSDNYGVIKAQLTNNDIARINKEILSLQEWFKNN